jgi:hypothetical protein
MGATLEDGATAQSSQAEPASPTDTRLALLDEARILELKNRRSGASHFKAAGFWSGVQGTLGGLAAVLSALAGASAFSDFNKGTVIAGALALTVTTLTAVTTFLNPSERANAHLRSGNAYLALQNRVRRFRRVEAPLSTSDVRALARQFARLSDELDELNRTSPQVSRWLYERARRQTDEDRRRDRGTVNSSNTIRGTVPASA